MTAVISQPKNCFLVKHAISVSNMKHKMYWFFENNVNIILNALFSRMIV